jgi:hypothetical protein
MKISGFTIIKNAVVMDYPIVEAIQSILPVVDEMVVLIGDCDDDTEGLIRSIGSDKIKIHHSVWDPNLRQGGVVLAVETDKAFQLIDPEADWAFYIQADEVIHESGHQAILEACRKYKDDKRVDVLVFPYKNFYATYDYVGDSRRWISKEGRVIKNDKSISSYRDAQGFRRNGQKLNGILVPEACVYHYSWVKSPEQMGIKHKNISKYWFDDEGLKQHKIQELFDYIGDYDSVEVFTGTHPSVMAKRIEEKNWEIKLDTKTKRFSLKDRFLYWIEKHFNARLFEFRNFRLLKP